MYRWMCYDRRKQRIKYVKAETQKKAAFKVRDKYGLIPYKTDDCKVLTEAVELTDKEEWRRFVAKDLKS